VVLVVASTISNSSAPAIVLHVLIDAMTIGLLAGFASGRRCSHERAAPG
jgi:hypothetical protein